MARSRDDDYEDDEVDDRPARRRRRDDDDDDYDDRPARRGGAKGPLDSMYADTNIVVLILFGCCCGVIAFVLSMVAYFTGKDPKAKSNAMIVIIISGIMMVLNIVAAVTGQFAQLNQGR